MPPRESVAFKPPPTTHAANPSNLHEPGYLVASHLPALLLHCFGEFDRAINVVIVLVHFPDDGQHVFITKYCALNVICFWHTGKRVMG